jgi:chemotaxis protein methyltransferase CheR
MTGHPGDISADNYTFLQQHVYRHSGIVLDEAKHYLFEARLLPVARKEGLHGLNQLCEHLRKPGSDRLVLAVRDAMTTNETLFFRDAIPFKGMREVLIGEVRERRQGNQRLRFWSAAASTGQEAYSLAMMLLDMGIAPGDIDILATDISGEVLEKAHAGRYTQAEVGRGLPAQQLVRYFRREKDQWQISDALRALVRFQPFDLRSSMNSFGPFDFVLCRNVLIYFDLETKKNILRGISRTLAPGGYLLLGAAETTLNLSDAFERRSVAGASFYQKL